MDTNITRRIALGTIIGGLLAGPFIIRAIRRRHLEFGPDSYLAGFRAKFQEALTFPRDYTPSENSLSLIAPSSKEQVLQVHKRYWENFSRIDEAEFDYSNHKHDANGQRMKGDNFCMDAHVKVKYGYGIEVKGKQDSGETIHWVFNMDGEATLPAAQKMNLSSMMLGFFGAFKAVPNNVMLFHRFYGKDLDLPENPHVIGKGKYVALDAAFDPWTTNPRVIEQYFRRNYFSQETGMLELFITQRIPPSKEGNSKDGYLGYKDESVPLPPPIRSYDARLYSKINGILIPSQIVFTSSKGVRATECYSNIKIKLLS